MYGHNTPGVYVTAPGPMPDPEKSESERSMASEGFVSIAVAFSFFAFWTFSGAGQPGNMVRLLAFKDTKTLKRSIMTVSIYFSFIYFSLVIIFCCARVMMPGEEIDADRIMPAMAVRTTTEAGVPWLAGLLLAAPFAAVMSSVDSFLLLVSSSVVRDVYQRLLRPRAVDSELKIVTYLGTLVVGVAAAVWAIHPPEYLQDLIIIASTGLSATFLVPVFFSLYWRRMNRFGAMAAMLGGFLTHVLVTDNLVARWIIQFFDNGLIKAINSIHHQTGIEPFLWDVLVAVTLLFVVTKLTPPPEKSLVAKYF